MGREKREKQRKEEQWKRICEEKGWVCKTCGAFPTDPGNPSGYETGYCPDHALPDPDDDEAISIL